MEIQDVFNIFFKIRDTIFWYWNFYVVGLFGLTGWLFAMKRKFPKMQKIIITFAYGAFSYLVCSGLVLNYSFLHAVYEELKVNISPETFLTNGIPVALSYGRYYKLAPYIIIGIHVVVSCAILVIVWKDSIRTAE